MASHGHKIFWSVDPELIQDDQDGGCSALILEDLWTSVTLICLLVGRACPAINLYWILQETAEEYAEKCDDLERKLLKRDKELEDYTSVQNNYKLTKTVCYELEDQIKELMKVIEKLESTQEK